MKTIGSRGHGTCRRADWTLKTSLERAFPSKEPWLVEHELLYHFLRKAPRLLPNNLVPHDGDVAAWLGLIQHYGGPTRLLDVSRSPYVALFYALEPPGDHDRALWAIDNLWCVEGCTEIMATNESGDYNTLINRATAAQAQLVWSLVNGSPAREPLFASFKAFTGVFLLDPWKPEARQTAQQGMFLCTANPDVSFMENLAALPPREGSLYKFVLPASIRSEALRRLAIMNVTAATLFPDLGGLARSLHTYAPRRARSANREVKGRRQRRTLKETEDVTA